MMAGDGDTTAGDSDTTEDCAGDGDATGDWATAG